MTASIGDRLNAARGGQLVGRIPERDLFRSAIEAARLPFNVLYVFGPGGVGKTTLLAAFAAHCEQIKIPLISLDARRIEPVPDAFLDSLRQALDLAPNEDPTSFLAADACRRVLLIDTYEALDALDSWVRDVFVPRLSDNILVVFAGRQPPSASWRADLGWQTMIRPLSLRNLAPEESRTFLRQRAVPTEQHRAVLDFTHGHPLALSLVADLFEQREQLRFEPDSAPDMIKTLLERFTREVPDPAHRAVLETCAIVHLTTEALLAHMLGASEAHELFEWLRGLSFVEAGWRGLFPHDLVRETLVADLRWRDPDRYADLHRRARAYYAARLSATQGQEQQRILFDYIFLHRDNPVVRSAFEWKTPVAVFADAVRESDQAALRRLIARQEGEESARLLSHWLARQPEATLVFRDMASTECGSEPAGFATLLSLHRADPADRDLDPATRAAWEYLRRQAPLRPGEKATHFRFWMARDSYQDVSPIQTLIVVNSVRQCLTIPGLAYTFFACADPDFWEPVFAYAEMQRVPEADFVVGGRHYGVFGNDWRLLPPTEWLALLAEKEIAGGIPVAPHRTEPLLVLSEPEFAGAVRAALRCFADTAALHENPLLRARVVTERAGTNTEVAGKIAALRALLEESVHQLLASPRLAKGGRAVQHTYLQPAPTQEVAADRLDLPFSTYRRHLTRGIEQMTQVLWHQEISSFGK